MEINTTPSMSIDIKQNERSYKFVMPLGCPIGEAYDAAYMVLQEMIKFAQQAEASAKRQENKQE